MDVDETNESEATAADALPAALTLPNPLRDICGSSTRGEWMLRRAHAHVIVKRRRAAAPERV